MATRGSWLVGAAIAGAVAGVVALACSDDPYAGAVQEEPASEAGADVSATDATTSDVVIPDGVDDAGFADDVVTVDAQKIDASGCMTCDCDGDGYNRAGCVDAGVDAGAIDCDDVDPSRHPGQAFVASIPPASQIPPGDWNCTNSVEKRFAVNFDCASFTSPCDTRSGFLVDPGCGTASDFVQCKAGVILAMPCAQGTITKKTQACR